MKIDPKDPQLHAQRQKVMLSIAKQFTNERGQVKLADAFKAQPDYQTQLADLGLDSPTRLNAYVLHMRRTGVLPQTVGFEGQKAPRKPHRKGVGSGNRKHMPEETYQQAFELIRQYRKGNKVDWAIAFHEHPELAKEMGYNGPGHNACMSFLNRARNRFKEGRTGARLPSHEPTASLPAANGVVAAPAPAPEPEPLPFNYCPKCGTNLLMFMTALKIAAKHSRRGE